MGLKDVIAAATGKKPGSPLKEDDAHDQDAAAERKAALATFQTALQEELRRCTENVLDAVRKSTFEEPTDADELERKVSDAFAAVGRVASDAGSTLQHTDTNVARRQLKTSSRVMAMKMETVRAAATVQLNNQKAELDAEHHRTLETRVMQVSTEEGTLLAEAHQKQEELQLQLDGLRAASKATQETLRTATKLQKAAERKADAAVAELAKVC
jgi:hypothetical protein